ncbi:MAG: DegT/DnrJ/EryC1/StrS family aminotransferase [Kiritimatiellia bacterium]
MVNIKSERLAIEGGKPVRIRPWPPRRLIGAAEKRAAMQVFDRAIRTGIAFGYNGPYEQAYEKKFAEMMGGGFADGVNSGTTAVYCALGALRLEPFSEVIVPAMTDPGGMMPVPLLGCVPVVADCDPRSYNTSAEQIARLISPRTRAIIVTHMGGEPADMDPIMELARAHNLYVIEDCAQAHRAKYKGRLVGTIGHIAAFSTMFNKHHCTGAQGGVVYTRNEELYWNAKRFADRGKPFNLPAAEGNVVAGLNCNLNDLSGAIGLAQLRKLPAVVERRHKIGEAVKRALKDSVVTVGWQVPQTWCTYWFLRLRVELEAIRVTKEQFCEALAAEGIGKTLDPFYSAIPSERPWFTKPAILGNSGFPWSCSDYKGPRTPQNNIENARQVTRTHFILWINERYGEREVEDIVRAIKKVEKAYLR